MRSSATRSRRLDSDKTDPDPDSIYGRMPASADPFTSDQDGDVVVKLQRRDRGTTGCSSADDPGAVLAPGEVPPPALTAWVEKPDLPPYARITSLDLSPFVAIAKTTGKPEVRFVVSPATRPRDDVLGLKPTKYIALPTSTIATAITGLVPDASHERGRSSPSAHGSSDGRSPRRTASLSA